MTVSSLVLSLKVTQTLGSLALLRAFPPGLEPTFSGGWAESGSQGLKPKKEIPVAVLRGWESLLLLLCPRYESLSC
jgi:hypothetical protein